MSAELLREAAALMRERAELATPGPWSCENAPNGLPPLVTGQHMAIAETFDKPDLPDAEHIASWHPTVALAVADWLDAMADYIELAMAGHPGWKAAVHHATTVARAYLGVSA